MRTAVLLLALVSLPALALAQSHAKPWTKEEVTGFMKELADYVVKHHLRRDDSPMRGKVYEFYDPATGQQGYGAGWDTMHDGGFFANACALAYLATGDAFYLDLVRDWILPFYLKVYNNSDTLFPDRADAFSDGQKLPPERSAAIKGWCPYWWDDGHGVNFDAIAMKITIKQLLRDTSTITNDANNREGKLAGYSHGTSNHMVLMQYPMFVSAWWLTRDPQIAEAFSHIRQARKTMINMDLPWLIVADLQAQGKAEEAHKVAGGLDVLQWPPIRSPLYQAMVAKRKIALTPFLDDPQGDYYGSVMGKRVGPGAAKRLAQVAYDVIRVQDLWYGDKPRPRGEMFGAENHPTVFITDGKFESLAGERPEVLVGSRLACQMLWACAQCLQLLQAFPEAWSAHLRGKYDKSVEGWSEPTMEQVEAAFRAELEDGLRYWRKQWKDIGYIRPHWPIGGKLPTAHYWQHKVSELGGYAHLIAACAEYLNLLNGKRHWELAWSTQAPAKR